MDTLPPANLSHHNDTEEWCLGWKLESTRPLTPAELDELQRESNDWQRQKWGFGCGCPFVFFAAMSLCAIVFSEFGAQSSASGWIIAISMLPLLIPVWMVLRFNDVTERLKGRHKDLQNGTLKCFFGPTTQFELPELLPAAENPPAAPQFDLYDSANRDVSPHKHWIEVLPFSQELFSLNGKRIKKLIAAPIATVAPAPQLAASAAYWHKEGGGDDATLRRLSAAEIDEIQRQSRAVYRRPLFSSIFLNLWIGVPLIAQLTLGLPVKIEPLAYLIFAAALFANWNLFRTLALSRKLKQDVAGGEVVLVRPPRKRAETAWQTKLVPELRADLWEVLPFSKVIWTADGRPSSWRKE